MLSESVVNDGIHLSPHVTYFIRKKTKFDKNMLEFFYCKKKFTNQEKKNFIRNQINLIDCNDPSIGVSIHPSIYPKILFLTL